MKLRPYQSEALEAVRQKLGPSRGIVAHATGLGKTVLAAAWIAEQRTRDPTARVLFLAHRDELIQQACERLGQWLEPSIIGVVKAERHEVDRPILVASVQSLVRRVDRTPRPSACVVDECHHAEARTYQRILDWLGPQVSTLGLSATPFRADGKPFDRTWPQGILHEISLRDGILRGYLADLRALRIRLDGSGEWTARVRRGDFVESDLEDCFRQGNGAALIASSLAERAAGRAAIVFTPTVATAQETNAACQAEGLRSACIYGEMSPNARFDSISSFVAGRLDVLTNCAVLTEGFDAPRASCIVIARPTRSRSLYLQMLGRGTRKYPGKDDCLVLDLVGASHRHDMQSVASAVGLPAWQQETIDTLERQSVAETFAKGVLHGKGVAEPIPLWKARPYAWVSTNVGYALGLGQEHGTLLLREHPALGWAIYQLRRGKAHAFVARAKDLETAQGTAEDIVRGLDVDRLVRRDEGWRHAYASPGQKDALGRLDVSVPDVRRLQRGEAADLLTKTITEIAWRR